MTAELSLPGQLLYALLRDQGVNVDALVADLDRVDGWGRVPPLLGVALARAARQVLPDGDARTVIRVVADARTAHDIGPGVDPLLAEGLLVTAWGGGDPLPAAAPDDTVDAALITLHQLTGHLSDQDLVALLAAAEAAASATA